MNMRNKSYNLGILAAALFVMASVMHLGWSIAYDTTKVNTTVNVTNAAPIILNVTINNNATINLSEGSTYAVTCNLSILEYNGLVDLARINGTFFRSNGTHLDADDDDNHYSNTSCDANGTINALEYTYWVACTFNVQYHAYNGSWNCTGFVEDEYAFKANGSGNISIYPLWAVNITDLIDYGNLAVGDTSATKNANVTNFGNQPLNLTVYGYGGTTNNATGGNWSFVCPQGTNISLSWERYSTDIGTPWASMTELRNAPALITDLTVDKKSYPDGDAFNMTYWALQVPPNPFGKCNGTVVFDAIAP
ncbi:MAG: hypothetical protein ABIH41_04395 [Nanoarchaeota archaeon]